MILEGIVIQQLYYNKENSYSIYKIELENGEIETIVGYLPPLVIDVFYKFETKEVNHKTYGIQYQVLSYEKSSKQDYNALINYLSSPIFTGIGPVRAARIVKHLGLEAIEKILADKTVLKALLFTPLQIERLYQELKKDQEHDKIMMELIKKEIPLDMASKLYSFYQKETLSVLAENPYQIIEDIVGFNFLRVDKIALKMGIPFDDKRRIEAGIIYALNAYIFAKGHTYLTLDQLLYAVRTVLKNIADKLIDEGLETLIAKAAIMVIDGLYTIKEVYFKEKNIATNLLKFNREIEVDKDLIISEVEIVEKRLNISYTKEQKEAIVTALTNPLTIITGGPGTGKTTILQGLMLVYSKLYNLNIYETSIANYIGLCAPTGRASRRMQEVMGIPAFTIHKLLGYDYEGKFYYDESNLLPQSLIVVDESSMIDIYLMDQLLKSINNKAIVVFVGDKDQLPSVGPGHVLGDMIDSNMIVTKELHEIHRQAQDSGIISLANHINEQTVENFHYHSSDDIKFIKIEQKDIFANILTLLDQALKENYSLYDDIQVLIPLYKGGMGIDNFNNICQNHLITKTGLSIQSGAITFYQNDKVIQLVNVPEKNIMNGDIGKVKDIYETRDGKIMIVDFDGNEVKYHQQELNQLNLAYAISVHKSQGSEYKIVFMPLARQYQGMLRKELLYTGITRAKTHLYLLGEMDLIVKAAKILNEKRQTMLINYLKEEEEEEKTKPITPFDFM